MNVIHNMSKVQLELKVRYLNKEFFKFQKKSKDKKGRNLVIIKIKKTYYMKLQKNQNIVIQAKDHSIVKSKNVTEI